MTLKNTGVEREEGRQVEGTVGKEGGERWLICKINLKMMKVKRILLVIILLIKELFYN